MNDKKQLNAKYIALFKELSGSMDINEYKNYFLGILFYKELSEKIEKSYIEQYSKDNNSLIDIHSKDEKQYYDIFKEKYIEKKGCFIDENLMFDKILEYVKNNEVIIDKFERGLKNLKNSFNHNKNYIDFIHLFDNIDLNSSRIGKNEEDRNNFISNIFKNISNVDFSFNNNSSEIDNYEYFISIFASLLGKTGGSFYTQNQLSKLMAKLVTIDKSSIDSVYDPACGSGSLLLQVAKESKVLEIYGQEKNSSTHNIAIMNMISHNIDESNFSIKLGDTLENPQHLGMKFEAIVSVPPFSLNWSPKSELLYDERFAPYGKLAPKTKADFAFIQHSLHHLDNNGTMAIVLPHGILFRGAAEAIIREHLIDKENCIDAIIGLPANMFYGTSIPSCILVIKKTRDNSGNILFIDASKCFIKEKNQNVLRDEDINKILDVYKKRANIEDFSSVSTLDKIKENEYNLNISRYINVTIEKNDLDLEKMYLELKNIEVEIKLTDDEINKCLRKLNIKQNI